MINDDILIKLVRQNPEYTMNWPGRVKMIKDKITYLLSTSFPGLNNDCLSLIKFNDIKIEDIIIDIRGSKPPVIYKIVDKIENINLEFVGNILKIGIGSDYSDLGKFIKPNQMLGLTNNNSDGFGNFNKSSFLFDDWLLKIDCRPTPNGGAGYYYFYKCPNDLRLSLNGIFKYIKDDK